MTTLRTFVAVAASGLLGCQVLADGQVNGITFSAREAIFYEHRAGNSPQADWVIEVIMSDQTDLCAALNAGKTLTNETFVAVSVDSETGQLNGGTRYFGYGGCDFTNCDALTLSVGTPATNCNSVTTPLLTPTSGQVTVDALPLAGAFLDGRFDVELPGGHVAGAFHAPRCELVNTAFFQNRTCR